jgi:signal transduction histidine kinase
VSTHPRRGEIAFQPRARLLKLIGEELISDEVVALSELVKNSHDADASSVSVIFRRVTGQEGTLEVRDDGIGMDVSTLLGRWMEPAASTKVGKGRQITQKGRRVLGEKGVGRFAADKLARCLEIVSRCSGRADEVQAVVDWDRYDNGSLLLSEVQNRWEVRPAREVSPHGTLLRMTGLRTVWSERTFRRLSIRLSRLLSPFRQNDSFVIRIESDEFPHYSGELRGDFLERAPYRVEAEFDGRQDVSLSLNGRPASVQRWNGQGELTCGPVCIRLYVFDLEAEALARVGPRQEARAWLREWTGVSIYRDGFRVWPYGEPHDDWLRLDQRRVNSPVEHLSNNQVIGFIEIGRDRNAELKDQTNREGLIHNQAFDDLRRLVYLVLQAVEAERQSIRHPARRATGGVLPGQPQAVSVPDELERLAVRAGGEIGRELRELRRRLDEQTAREQVHQQQMMEGYSGLAAIGQMSAGMLPLLPLETQRMQAEMEKLRAVLTGRKIPEAREAMEALAESLRHINEQQQLILAASGSAERRRAIDVTAEIAAFQDVVRPLLDGQGFSIEVTCPAAEVMRTEMRPENFFCLLQILTSNSLDWARRVEAPRIRIVVAAEGDRFEIIFSDNGPGIGADVAGRIFEPLFSRKEGGRGMGLTIARQMVEAHGGSISLILDGRRRGANFQILLPRKRSRATIYGGR